MIDRTGGKFLPLFAMVLGGLVAASPVLAQNTNTTYQEGRVNINISSQCGGNNNVTHQVGKVNINRTRQGSCKNQRLKVGRIIKRIAKKAGKHKR